MALLNGLENVAKGSSATITLDKTALFSLPSVAADGWFSIEANVEEVVVVYHSSQGGQKKELTFNMTQASPSDVLSFSLKSRDVFSIAEIIVYDFDRGHMSVPVSDIPAGLDIIFHLAARLDLNSVYSDVTPPGYCIFHAVNSGVAGNNIQIAMVGNVYDKTESFIPSVDINGNLITFNINGNTMVTDIINLIASNTAISDLISFEDHTGAGYVYPFSATNLSGGF